MDPIASVVIPGFFGGLAVALIIFKLQRRSGTPSDAFADRPLSTDVINMARIRVAGVGGLGLVAMALVVAWFVPRIGQTLLFGAVLGAALAVGLILRRRRAGPMPSSGRSAGANTTLSIDSLPGSGDDEPGRPPDGVVRGRLAPRAASAK